MACVLQASSTCVSATELRLRLHCSTLSPLWGLDGLLLIVAGGALCAYIPASWRTVATLCRPPARPLWRSCAPPRPLCAWTRLGVVIAHQSGAVTAAGVVAAKCYLVAGLLAPGADGGNGLEPVDGPGFHGHDRAPHGQDGLSNNGGQVEPHGGGIDPPGGGAAFKPVRCAHSLSQLFGRESREPIPVAGKEFCPELLRCPVEGDTPDHQAGPGAAGSGIPHPHLPAPPPLQIQVGESLGPSPCLRDQLEKDIPPGSALGARHMGGRAAGAGGGAALQSHVRHGCQFSGADWPATGLVVKWP